MNTKEKTVFITQSNIFKFHSLVFFLLALVSYAHFVIAICFLICGILLFFIPSPVIAVTSDRILVKNLYRTIDIPIHAVISARLSSMCGITVYTHSKKITFRFYKNHNKLHTIIQFLIIAKKNNLPILNKLLEEIT